jgi:acyl-CoA reductase-like NAD-dependent aldehyde dehydrogenase
LSPVTQVNPLIQPRKFERVESWIAEAVAKGAQVLVGGKR